MIKNLVAVFYIVLTLLPNSHTLVVTWPWVLIWQIALITPVVWLLVQTAENRKLFLLGSGFDILALFLLMGTGINAAFAQHPNQAIWQSIVLLCFLSGLYALNQWLHQEQCSRKLFLFQGVVSFAFIVVSLMLWMGQTVYPELLQLQTFEAAGVAKSFDLSQIPLRNWHPLGHQNYVAGYLCLALPVLFSLGLQQSGWRRYFWFSGLVLGLIDLYTTYSRAGFLCIGLCSIIFCIGIMLQKKTSASLAFTIPRRFGRHHRHCPLQFTSCRFYLSAGERSK